MAQEVMAVKFEGKEYSLEDFELGDLEWLEEYLDTTLDDVKKLTSMKAAVAFVYLIKRRDNAEFTLDDARKVKLSVFEDPDAPGDKTNGDTPARKRPTKRAPA
jgi:hypothetical protein